MFLIEDVENETTFLRIWLKQDRMGYTTDIEQAGRFTRAEAISLEHAGFTKMWDEIVAVNNSRRGVIK